MVIRCLPGRGSRARGPASTARATVGAVVPLHARFGVSSFPAEQTAYERQLLAARAQLGEEAYAVAWAAGQALTLEQAIAEALNR